MGVVVGADALRFLRDDRYVRSRERYCPITISTGLRPPVRDQGGTLRHGTTSGFRATFNL